MAFSSMKLVAGPLPARLGDPDLPLKRPAIISTRKSLPLQVKSEGEWKPEAPLNLGVSRREMMIYLAGGTLIGQTEPVEARTTKPEIRRKIREKLEMLREKAGLSKPKNENGIKAPPAEPAEKKLSPSQPPIPVVEANLP
ncbi:uncharacterized protein LOC121254862 [Juglans microcarpa x Juglans regia]|uniref:uncharacterized protein LOC121254862 n=1 Tax=Juglans microcarpa x Juglans regia TaxID=2249226 RepID=UPI001B7F4F49|nr:uncharacterized protein LOC121254862 [Juglans microcarpa x Juglans regia]